MAAGEIRRVSVPHTVQTLIGMTVFHFATGDFGEDAPRRPALLRGRDPEAEGTRRVTSWTARFVRTTD